jgi:hypothetical protein
MRSEEPGARRLGETAVRRGPRRVGRKAWRAADLDFQLGGIAPVLSRGLWGGNFYNVPGITTPDFVPILGRWLTRGAAQDRRGLMFRGGAPLARRVPPISLREALRTWFSPYLASGAIVILVFFSSTRRAKRGKRMTSTMVAATLRTSNVISPTPLFKFPEASAWRPAFPAEPR